MSGPKFEAKHAIERNLESVVGDRFVLKLSVKLSGARELRERFFDMAIKLLAEPKKKGIYIIFEPEMTNNRIRNEAEKFESMFQESILKRLTVISISFNEAKQAECIQTRFFSATDFEIEDVLPDLVVKLREVPKEPQVDYDFFIKKLLVLKSLTHPEFVSRDWIKKTVGCSYSPIDRTIDSLGALLERNLSRKLRLKYVSEDLLSELALRGPKARSTKRFSFGFGPKPSPQDWFDRLGNGDHPEIVMGGILGALVYFPDLDIAGTPRIDLSIQSIKQVNYSVLDDLFPGLEEIKDPSLPCDVVVHSQHHSDPFPRTYQKKGVADEVECLLDLFEQNLKTEGHQFKVFLGNKAAKQVKERLDTNSKTFKTIINLTDD